MTGTDLFQIIYISIVALVGIIGMIVVVRGEDKDKKD